MIIGKEKRRVSPTKKKKKTIQMIKSHTILSEMNCNQSPLGSDSTAAALVVEEEEEEDTLLGSTPDNQEVAVEDNHHTPLVEVVEGQDSLVVVEVHTLQNQPSKSPHVKKKKKKKSNQTQNLRTKKIRNRVRTH